jgi:hypothetical protein
VEIPSSLRVWGNYTARWLSQLLQGTLTPLHPVDNPTRPSYAVGVALGFHGGAPFAPDLVDVAGIEKGDATQSMAPFAPQAPLGSSPRRKSQVSSNLNGAPMRAYRNPLRKKGVTLLTGARKIPSDGCAPEHQREAKPTAWINASFF